MSTRGPWNTPEEDMAGDAEDESRKYCCACVLYSEEMECEWYHYFRTGQATLTGPCRTHHNAAEQLVREGLCGKRVVAVGPLNGILCVIDLKVSKRQRDRRVAVPEAKTNVLL
jgi:hypothetical protein